MPAFLETDRLVLRGFTEADADHLYELNRDRDVMWFLTGGKPTPREEVRDRIVPFFLSGETRLSPGKSASGPAKTYLSRRNRAFL